jgi:transposase
MKRGRRYGLTAGQMVDIWRRWKAGESLHEIGRALGEVLVKKKFTQKQLLAYTANLQTSLIGLGACSGAHFLGRALRKQGHDVRLIAAQFVKPFVKSNKNWPVNSLGLFLRLPPRRCWPKLR